MPDWKPFLIPNAPAPVGPYSPAVRAGNHIYISGQIPKNPLTGELAGEDIASQTRQVLENVKRLVELAGGSMADIVSVVVYLQDVDQWADMNSVYKEYFSPPFPTRTAVGADLRGILVEISAVAYVA